MNLALFGALASICAGVLTWFLWAPVSDLDATMKVTCLVFIAILWAFFATVAIMPALERRLAHLDKDLR